MEKNLLIDYSYYEQCPPPVIDEVGEFVLSVCPNHKNVVDEMPPHKRLVRGFVKGIGFKDSHKDIGVGWCHSCTHRCAMFL